MCKKLIYLISFVFVLSLASSAYAELVAYWTFNHDPNDSIGDLNWTLENGADYSYWIDRKEGSHTLSLDGIDDRAYQDAVGPLIDPFTEKSVALWFKAASTSGVQVLYEEGGATNGLAIDVNDSTIDAVVQNNHVIFATSTPFDSTEWTHVAATFDNGLLVLYVNGAEAGSVMADFAEVASHSNGPGVGARNGDDAYDRSGTGDYFGGLIDYVVLYDHVLSADEVADLAAPPNPWSPIPLDGAMHAATSVDLSWTPGINAASHNVYLGDNVDNVVAGTEDTLKGSPAISQLTVADLAPETTYYWRVDDVEEDGTTVHTGDVWSFTLPAQTAYDPSPVDGALFVDPTTILSWTPGLNAESHTVYIGDNFDDVNNAADGTLQEDATYTPKEPLATGKVYYWRVDEFDGTDTHKGDVWSFETPPFMEITDPNLVAWWKLDGEYFDLGYVVDYSGHNHHGTPRGDPQLVEGYDGGAMEFDGSDDYINIDGYKGIVADENGVQPAFSVSAWFKTTGNGEIVTWGSSPGGQRFTFRLNGGRLRTEHGNGNLQGDTTCNDGDWHNFTLTVPYDAPCDDPDTVIYLDGVVDTRTSTGTSSTYDLVADTDVNIGRRATSSDRYFPGTIDDVRIYDKALTELEVKVVTGFVMSSNPEPADGAKLVDNLAILGWSPGPFGAEFDVYFGTNPEPGADELVGRVSEPTHFATDLAEGQTYYWRIDDVEADGTTIHTGDIWSFWIPPKGAYNPQPADGQAVTDTETDLSWVADWNPVMYVVHFGTDADQVTNALAGFGPPLMEAGFDPGPLEPGTTYYWRADVFYGTWITGPVWSFTVSAPE